MSSVTSALWAEIPPGGSDPAGVCEEDPTDAVVDVS